MKLNFGMVYSRQRWQSPPCFHLDKLRRHSLEPTRTTMPRTSSALGRFRSSSSTAFPALRSAALSVPPDIRGWRCRN